MNLTVLKQGSGVFAIIDKDLFNSGGTAISIDSGLLVPNNTQQPFGNDQLRLNAISGNLSVSDGVVSFSGAEYRTDVLNNFDDFLTKVEQNEGRGVTPGAAGAFRRILGNVLPANFAESLYFNYGYFRSAAPFKSVVDVLPGMRLRIESQVSQLVPATSSSGSSNPFANAYVVSGQSYIDVVEIRTARTPLTGFDAFLASNVTPQVDVSGDGAAAGLIDVAGRSLQRRWFRLVYPSQFSAGDSAGSTGGARNPILLGADTLSALKQATDQAVAGQAVTVAGAVSLFFRGRTFIVPEIMIFLNSAPVWVSLGTTVRQLFDRFGYIPHLSGFHPRVPLQRYAPGASLASRSGNSAHPNPYSPVTFESPTLASPVTDAYDLPLLGGDAYSINS